MFQVFHNDGTHYMVLVHIFYLSSSVYLDSISELPFPLVDI